MSQEQSGTLKVSRFNMAAAIHNRRGVIGSFAWGLADQKTSANPEDQWGLYDNTGFAQAWPAPSTAPLSVTSGKRTIVTDLIQRLNVADRIDAAYKPQNMLDARRAKPRNAITTAATGWISGGNTYLYAEPRGLGFSATAIGTSFVATSSTSVEDRIPVAGATYCQGRWSCWQAPRRGPSVSTLTGTTHRMSTSRHQRRRLARTARRFRSR